MVAKNYTGNWNIYCTSADISLSLPLFTMVYDHVKNQKEIERKQGFAFSSDSISFPFFCWYSIRTVARSVSCAGFCQKCWFFVPHFTFDPELLFLWLRYCTWYLQYDTRSRYIPCYIFTVFSCKRCVNEDSPLDFCVSFVKMHLSLGHIFSVGASCKQE